MLYMVSELTGVFTFIAAILAIAATVLAFIFIVPQKRRAKLNKFGQFIHDTLNFKFLIIEKILQALYIFATAYVILFGVLELFDIETGYGVHWNGGYGILMIIVGPIIVRLGYELLMMIILLVKNVISINNKLKNQNDGNNNTDDIFVNPSIDNIKEKVVKNLQNANVQTTQVQQPVQTQQPTQNQQPAQTAQCCSNCGELLSNGPFCVKCGTKNN